MKRKKVMCVIGTRPEAIKMAPVVLRLRERKDEFDLLTVATAQHRELLDDVFRIFNLRADADLDVMRPDQTLTEITIRILEAMPKQFDAFHPDVVLAQGDTTTVMAAATACFFRKIRFGHVEAGLRTGDLFAPYPEEFNRRVVSLATHYHFAPTEGARRNLLAEGVQPDHVHVTGNPIVDALRHILARTQPPPMPVPAGAPYVLMTCHRRESFGAPIRGMFGAVREFARRHPELKIWYPVHPNPNVSGPAREILDDVANVLLTKPVDYVTLLHAMRGCRFVLTDSGGIQEEGVTLGKPVLVLRSVTERPEGVEAGGCRLVGTDPDAVGTWLERLFTDGELYKTMSAASGVFGDGRTAERIADILAAD